MGHLLLLEDDAERLGRFRLACERLRLPLLAWRSAFDFLAALDDHLPAATLISLDHDLIAEAGEPDLGDGVMVAKELANRTPCCPVIVHTSNGVRGDWMEGELQLAGWAYSRVAPLGDDWIEVDWYRGAKRLLRAQPRTP
jgi:hypothetical protein